MELVCPAGNLPSLKAAVDNGADHTSTNELEATHTAHATSSWVTGCDDCHAHDGVSVAPGTGVQINSARPGPKVFASSSGHSAG